MSRSAPLSPEQVLRRLFWRLLFRGRAAQQMQSHRTMKQASTAMTLFLYALLGLMPAIMAFNMETVLFASLLHGFTIMLASLSLATSVGSMLFIKEEAEILLHRPVTPQQLLRAKASVLLAFSLLLALALNFAGMIASLWSKGGSWLFIPTHIFTTILLMVFSIGCLILVYNLCLKWFGREKLDNLLATLQSAVSVVMIVSSQLLPRVIGPRYLQHFSEIKGWALALPPVWFGALDALLTGTSPWQQVALPAGLAVVSTLAAVWLGFGKLSSAYGDGLMALNENSTAAPESGSPRKERRLPRLLQRLPFRHWLKNPVERQAFLLTSAYMARDREIKLKLYPGIAPMLFMPLLMIFSLSGLKSTEASTWGQAFAACYLAVVPLQAMSILNRSEHWRAAAFFYAAPLPHWAPLFHGARKAVLLWLTYPILILQGVTLSILQRSPTPLAMTLPAFLFLPAFSMVPGLMKGWLPLALPPEEQRDAGTGCLHMIAVMLVSSALGGLAMWAWKLGTAWFSGFIVLELLLMIVVCALFNRHLHSRGWEISEAP